jgi:prepilin-type N-terminal cleavage/methylation domain-containing protein
MKKRLHPPRREGFTIVELLVGSAVGAVVALGVFAFINTGSLLAARNLSVNHTSNGMRGALDRVEHLLQQSNSTPVLMNAAGGTVASNLPAAGVRFDLFQGKPVVINPGTTTLASAANGFTIRYAQACSRPPTASDIVAFDSPATLRPRIASITSTAAPSVGMRDSVVVLTAALGQSVTGTTALRGTLVRDVALCVVTAGGNRELRYYHDMRSTTNMNDPAKFHLITDQIATETAADATPFTLRTIDTGTFVNVSLRMRANRFDRRLSGKQADQFNTFAQVISDIRPKINP